MSAGGDWQDPFAEDEAARERERRRAERDARRRAQRESLGEKVAAAPEQPAGQPSSAPAQGDVSSEREGGGVDASASTDGAGPVTADVAGPRRRARSATSAARARAQQALARIQGGRRPPPDVIRRRRIAGAVAALVVGGLLIFGLVKLVDGFGGDEAPSGPATLRVGEVTIPEGLDRRQIAAVAEEAGLRGNYERASRGARGFNPAEYGASDPPSLEGFLFPATYELEKNASVEDLVSRQLEAFEDNIRRVDMSYARSKNLNVYDVLNIASMIEREVQVDDERRMVAAVIYNRLAAGDMLGIDATIRYEDQNYDEQLTEERLNEDTPYNTRTRAGLPPTPIGNPGLASIRAAANPARSDAYYFVVKPGTCGEHVFAETEAEFNEAAAEYQAALEAEGGSPTEC